MHVLCFDIEVREEESITGVRPFVHFEYVGGKHDLENFNYLSK